MSRGLDPTPSQVHEPECTLVDDAEVGSTFWRNVHMAIGTQRSRAHKKHFLCHYPGHQASWDCFEELAHFGSGLGGFGNDRG